jgi:hypothetical protein
MLCGAVSVSAATADASGAEPPCYVTFRSNELIEFSAVSRWTTSSPTDERDAVCSRLDGDGRRRLRRS